LALEQAHYEADRRRRQFNAVEPENRLVLRELQALWNEALAEVDRLEQQVQREKESQLPSLDATQRQELFALATDLPRLWNLPSTDERTQTRLLRTLIERIVGQAEPQSQWSCFTIHWAGGVHSELRLKRNRQGEHGRKTSKEVVELVKELALITADRDIARILNRCHLQTGTGQSWTQSRVKSLRQAYDIPVFSQKAYESSGVFNLRQAAEHLAVSPQTVLRLINSGMIQAKQVVRHAPWSIPRSELDKAEVTEAIGSIKKHGKAQIHINQQRLSLS